MAQGKVTAQSIYNLEKAIDRENPFPIYFFFGEDSYAIEKSVKQITKAFRHLIDSDFDMETITVEKKQPISSMLDIASAFPFGSGKKIIVVKNFENFDDKKHFESYAKSPAESTILIISSNEKIKDLSKPPYYALIKKGYIFEAKELKGAELYRWVVSFAKTEGLSISLENATMLVEIVGEDKALLEMQVRKFKDFLSDSTTIDQNVIEQLASQTKEYTIFNFTDAIGSANKSEALKIGIALLDQGLEIIFIINMLSRYFITIANALELSQNKIADNDAARMLGISYYYYKNCRKARYFFNFNNLHTVSNALLNADMSVKTSAASSKSILTTLISQIFSQNS